MCVQYLKLKTKNAAGTKFAYVPCGECVECRRKLQNDWKFRLNAEFLTLKKLGWHIAFMTLTYREDTLPHIPKVLFKDEGQYRSIPCFSKDDVTKWITSIRHYCKYHYKFVKENAIRYFVASEYGEHTHRPHYHAILAWPPSVSYEVMHAICSDYWNHGFMFPRRPEGDVGMLPFQIVGNMSKAMNYVSKYVCKDLTFKDQINGLDLDTSKKLYKNIQSFHLQSKSIGFSYVKNLTDQEKLNVYMNGTSFQGDGESYRLPVYVKNKIIFDYNYVTTASGKRLVRRKGNAFFNAHKEDIFKAKGKFYEKLFRNVTSIDWFVNRGVEKEQAERFTAVINNFSERLHNAFGFDVAHSQYMSQYYLAYFGVDHKYCRSIHSFSDMINQWYNRYLEEPIAVPESEVVDYSCWKAVQDFGSFAIGCTGFCNLVAMARKSADERLNAKILDYFNSLMKPYV